jgi:hypothetical protein
MASFGAGHGPVASFGALPSLPTASFGAVASFGARRGGFVWGVTFFSDHRPPTINH